VGDEVPKLGGARVGCKTGQVPVRFRAFTAQCLPDRDPVVESGDEHEGGGVPTAKLGSFELLEEGNVWW